MQFITFTLSALSVASALAQTVHVVTVGSSNGSTVYSPNNINAPVGDFVQFQFSLKNHSVVQSTFDQPCQPIASNSNITGFFSGFMGVSATDTDIPTYTIPIANSNPIWFYCAQATHCQKGMVGVINQNPAANATRSLTNYAALAATQPFNLFPGESASQASSSSSSSSGSSGSSSSGTTTSSGSATTTTGSTQATANAGSILSPAAVASWSGILAMGMVIFI